MSYLGARPVGSTITLDYTTGVNGIPRTLAGSPVVSVYKNSTTETATGVTLTADYDSRTGMNHVVIDTSADGTFYAAGNDFSVVVTTGTLDGVSVAGAVIALFSLTELATNIDKTGKAIGRGTCTTGSSTTSVTTSAFSIAPNAADQFKDRVILFDKDTTTQALRGVAKTISASTNSATPTFTVATLPGTPVSGDTFSVI